jgi:DNA excision repair protein ERCC-2
MCSSTGQGLNDFEPGHLIPSGIWTLADIMDRGKSSNTCPYFTIRRMVSLPVFQQRYQVLRPLFQMPFVDVIIYSFHYLLDPKVAEQVSKELSKDAIVVFDEAHNIGTTLDQPLILTHLHFSQITFALSPLVSI